MEGDEVKIHRKFPFGGQTVLAHFSLSSGMRFHREVEALVQDSLPRPSTTPASD